MKLSQKAGEKSDCGSEDTQRRRASRCLDAVLLVNTFFLHHLCTFLLARYGQDEAEPRRGPFTPFIFSTQKHSGHLSVEEKGQQRN